MANPGDFAYTVKQQADIVRIVGEYVKLKRSGAQNYSGICPFHNEKTGSFSVHATRQFYHCFGCHASGDVFSFVQKIENITFPEAVRAVAQKLGIAMPKMQFSSPQEAKEAKQRVVLMDLHELACKFFQEQLRRPEAGHAREYLKGRGLSDEAVEKFRIGFAPDSGFLLRDFLKDKAEDELLRDSGLFSWKQEESRDPKAQAAAQQKAALYSKFRNRVLFPICNETGKVIAFTGRTLAVDEKSGPKYLNSPETPIYSKSRVLYNLHLAKEAIRALDYAILVEGQMDCISVFNAGFHNVIASSGTAFTEAQARLLGRFSKKIIVNFDPDTAGAAAAERSLTLLVSEEFEIRVLTLEQGFDPDLFIRRKGAPAYKDSLRTSTKYFDYLIERARSLFPVRTAEGKVKAVNYLLPHVQRVPSRIVRDELASDIAQKLQIDSAVLRQELKHVAADRSSAKVTSQLEQRATDSLFLLIRALATKADLGNASVSSREGEDTDFEPARQVHFVLSQEKLHAGSKAETLIDCLLRAEEDGSDPLSLELSEADRSLLAKALMDDHEVLTPDLLESSFATLRIPHLEARQRELRLLVAETERKNDASTLTKLLSEKLQIDCALNRAKASIS